MAARPILPSDAQPLALVILTTHEGHFLGPALSHLLVWRDDTGAWIRDIGAWDPRAPHLAATYRLADAPPSTRSGGPPRPRAACSPNLLLSARRAAETPSASRPTVRTSPERSGHPALARRLTWRACVHQLPGPVDAVAAYEVETADGNPNRRATSQAGPTSPLWRSRR